MQEGENLLGRTEEAAVWIDSSTGSRHHARIVVGDGKVLLEDLGSRNGTWVRGKRLAAPVELSDGEEFRVGRIPVTVRRMRAGSSTRSTSRP